MDPGTIIALTQTALTLAFKAVNGYKNALCFISDSERLVGRLDWHRLRLQGWAETTGLTKDPPSIPDHLLGAYEALKRKLEEIESLFSDADEIRARYDLPAVTDPKASPERVRNVFARIAKSLQESGVKTKDFSDSAVEAEVRDGPGIGKRARWGFRDKEQFESRINKLDKCIQELEQHLAGAQRRKLGEDMDRLRTVVVSNIVDQHSLTLVRFAVAGEPAVSAIVERRAILDGQPWSMEIHPRPGSRWNLTDFHLEQTVAGRRRVLARSRSHPGDTFMLERKDFGRSITADDKRLLASRVQRLTVLLGEPKSSNFRVLQCVGLVDDPDHFCWWLVFRFSTGVPVGQPLLSQPVSLLSLLHPGFQPALEHRLTLASRICHTLWGLYASGWLHKGIRSENVLFEVGSQEELFRNEQLLCSPLVSGFDYSRQESEARTIDKAKSGGNIATAMYRHPNYQGEAAEGYKIQYDIYSVGLVLMEICLWVPLTQFRALEASAQTSGGQASRLQRPGSFHRDEAIVLQKQVVNMADSKLAFLFGTDLYKVIKWCLVFADQNATGPSKNPVLEFYDNVVAPLARQGTGAQHRAFV